MAAPSRETLQRIASETGHQPGTLEKVLRLLDLLQEIAADDVLGSRLALKGGTALNVFYLPLDRLSVDIDVNYIGAVDRDAMLAERPALEEAANRLLAAQGYQVRRQPDEHAGGKWIARHASALGGQGALEIDINFMMRQPLFGVTRMDSVRVGEAQAKGVTVLDLHEIIAGKLVALLDRRAARDLFDARRIFAMEGLNWSWIKAAMLAIGAAGRNDWRAASVDKIGADSKELRQKLLICLPRAHFEDAGSIEAWIEETTALCRTKLAPVLALTDGETAFLDGVIERGEIDTSGLEVASDIQARIARMPMLQWKAENVRKRGNQ
jgi:predicted nucleotidyltransferase component of viral defense system